MIIDMSKLISDSFDKKIEDGTFEKMIDQRVDSVMKDAIESATGWNSAFKKNLENHVKEALSIDVKTIDLSTYGAVLSKLLKERITASMHDAAGKSISQFLVNMESRIPAELKISDIVEKIVEYWKEEDSDKAEEGFEFTLHFAKWKPSYTWNFEITEYDLFLSKEEDQEPNKCEIHIRLNLKKDGMFEIVRVSFRSESMEDKKAPKVYEFGGHDDFHSAWLEGYLFQLYAAKPRITDDSKEIDTCVSGYEDEDY